MVTEVARAKREAKRAVAAGKYEKAVECYTHVLEHISSEEDKHLVLLNRSAAFMKLEKHREAADDARAAIPNGPSGSIKAHYRLACALHGAAEAVVPATETAAELRLKYYSSAIEMIEKARNENDFGVSLDHYRETNKSYRTVFEMLAYNVLGTG